jgi:hypothetical protein
MKFVVTLDLESFPEVKFDEFCENLRENIFPRCEERGIMMCIRKWDDMLVGDPFDSDLLKGMLLIIGVLVRLHFDIHILIL